MMRKSLILIVFVGLLAPTIAALCQSQCHFMSDSEHSTQSALVAADAQRMECCAIQQPVLKKPIAELPSNSVKASLLDAPITSFSVTPDKSYFMQEGLPGPSSCCVTTSSSPILRV
jgi:hypothetical protein